MEYNVLMQKLIDRNLLTVVDDKICIKPHTQYDFTTFPIDMEDCIQITEEEYLGLITYVYMFDETLTNVVDYVNPVIGFEVLGEEPVEEQEEQIDEPVDDVEEEAIEDEEEQNTEEIINE